MFKLIGNIRNLIKNAFIRKYTRKSKKTTEILGCDFNYFHEYIGNQFDENMTWDNYGSYGETIERVVELNNYKNLRPLKKEENRSKGNR